MNQPAATIARPTPDTASVRVPVHADGPAPSTNPWHERLYHALRTRATPLFVFDDAAIPAASVWTGARRWIARFRAMGLEPGERVLLALEPSPAFLMALAAALWEGLTVAIAPPGDDIASLAQDVDARLAIARMEAFFSLRPTRHNEPDEHRVTMRKPRFDRQPDVRLLLRTSGTTARPKWIALGDRGLLSVIDSHSPELGLTGDDVVASVLPWHHAFGLVIDLLPALFAGATVVRDPHAGRDPDAMIDLATRYGVTRLSMVPLQARRLAATERGRALLTSLRGGVIGGAPVRSELTDLLNDTALRAGYGQTEASPGVCLGQPGLWEPGLIGTPVGCSVFVDDDDQLHVSGPNLRIGTWSPEDGLRRADPAQPLATGDLVRASTLGYVFDGRVDDAFKLANGRYVAAAPLEAGIRTRVHRAADALVTTIDGRTIDAVLLGLPSVDATIEQRVRDALGPMAHLLRTVHAIHDADSLRSPKGSIDRGRVIRSISGVSSH